jgi:sensor c-di-GMP phosphodiesterase-like protein
VVAPRSRNLAAIVVGVLLAGIPVAALNVWLFVFAERQVRSELDLSALRTAGLAEGRLAHAARALDDLALRGIDSCRQDHVEALRRAAFAVTPAKEFTIVAPDGRTLCSDHGNGAEVRTIVASEPLIENRRHVLDLVRLGDNARQWVRIRRPGAGQSNGVAVLIPTELLVPNVSTRGGSLDSHVRVVARGGMHIASAGEAVIADVPKDELVFASHTSQRYGLRVTMAAPRALMASSLGDLRLLGSAATGLIAILILVIAALLPRRRRANPIEDIERALNAGEFVPYYQPIVDIRTGRLRGAEVLIRWRKPDGSLVTPAAFIPLVESSGLILEMTRVLMRSVCREIGPAYGARPNLRIGFNMAARHFADEEIVGDVRSIFKSSPLRLSQVVLEVTERQPLDNLTETRRVVAALQGLGVKVAIDDVGTGHNGLSYMLKLGVDIIKIDKIFIDSVGTDRNSHTIIETLLDLAQNMRMEVVAEGVESFEQVEELRELGVRAAQGFVFAPPLPGATFLQLLDAIEPLKDQGNSASSADPGASAAHPKAKAA